MHIIIAALTAIGGLAWALYRLQESGLDLNAFNPFYWARRRAWAKKYGAKPIHCLTNPMEAAAALVVGSVHLDGVVTREQKYEAVAIFTDEFNITNQEASELFSASAYLLSDVSNLPAEVKNILAPSIDQFKPNHKQSLLDMLDKVSRIEGEPTKEQIELVDAVKSVFTVSASATKQW
ncbi:hypothetical protein QWI17_08155 [Gilvimarinus sp. SDUM040013]|uniref:Co-chaperone DjlA N-terminal domain-containing protein n=1 Tax=Gilvimarinus gilvus TaxID=3058038 RepID=A0ABU4S2L4_9GAMM|nr:hypothetical protein [Gilvimarinus sp. SDUM040013]MDO3385807.1 hypothetical protein [Gilvimarinus sp. SDUM040013]MDX6850631.1 hypothetical protein [Gilvimarinus sp. SDUM040013]